MSRGRKGGRGPRRKKANPYKKADRFTQQAKEEGYAARSVYKLTEIQRRFRVLRAGDKVVDLGCSPGSWAKYAVEQVGGRGGVAGIDINEPAYSGFSYLVKSALDVEASELEELLGGKADVVLSDMAPLTTGVGLLDHVQQLELAQRAFDLSLELLKPGGNFVVKVFDGEDAPAFVANVRKHFTKTKRVKPEAVRRESREFFLVCLGRKPSADS